MVRKILVSTARRLYDDLGWTVLNSVTVFLVAVFLPALFVWIQIKLKAPFILKILIPALWFVLVAVPFFAAWCGFWKRKLDNDEPTRELFFSDFLKVWPASLLYGFVFIFLLACMLGALAFYFQNVGSIPRKLLGSVSFALCFWIFMWHLLSSFYYFPLIYRKDVFSAFKLSYLIVLDNLFTSFGLFLLAFVWFVVGSILSCIGTFFLFGGSMAIAFETTWREILKRYGGSP